MKRLAVLISAGALLLGGVAAAAPAQASVAGPACSGPTCFGKSPYKFVNREGVSCHDDAHQVRDSRGRIVVASPDGSLNLGAVLWFSPSCQANWVEVDPNTGCGPRVEFEVDEADGRVQPMPGDGHFYTLMVDGTGVARAGIKCPGSTQQGWVFSIWI